jgi:hypothetical protein
MIGPRECRSCGADRVSSPQPRWACKGLCGRCYRRWANQGFPYGGPLPPHRSGRPELAHGSPASRIRLYREKLAGGASTADICLALGVTRRTLERYRTVIAEEDAADGA